MDRNYYYNARAEEQKREISRALATQTLLKDHQREPLTMKQAKRMVLRIAPAVIIMVILVISFMI